MFPGASAQEIAASAAGLSRTAADLDALQEVLNADFPSLEAMRERLREIVAPDLPPFPLVDGRAIVPRLD